MGCWKVVEKTARFGNAGKGLGTFIACANNMSDPPETKAATASQSKNDFKIPPTFIEVIGNTPEELKEFAVALNVIIGRGGWHVKARERMVQPGLPDIIRCLELLTADTFKPPDDPDYLLKLSVVIKATERLVMLMHVPFGDWSDMLKDVVKRHTSPASPPDPPPA